MRDMTTTAPDGTVSKKGNFVAQGGQWIPNPAKQAAPVAPAGTSAQAMIPSGPPQPSVPLGGYTELNRVAATDGLDEPPPPPPWPIRALEGALSAGGKALEIADIPFKPMHYAIDKVVREPLKKIPAMAKPFTVPESMAQALAGAQTGDFPEKYSKEGVPFPPAADMIATGLDFAAYPAYLKGAGKLLRGLGRATGVLKRPLPENPALGNMTESIEKSMSDVRAKLFGSPEIESNATVIPGSQGQYAGPRPEGAAAMPTGPSPEFMGPLTQPAAPAPRPSSIPALMPERQQSLFPPAMMSPPQYGAGRGIVEPAAPIAKSVSSNFPLQRLGTESAKNIRTLRDLDRLRQMLGIQ
jgi:hypothetical protein